MNIEVIKLPQKSVAWLRLRSECVFTASEVSLMGLCPYQKTVVSLLNEKTGVFNKKYREEKSYSQRNSMSSGNTYEDFVIKTLEKYRAKVYLRTLKNGYKILASLDGESAENEILEIKLTSYENYQIITATNSIPPNFYSQVQSQMFIADKYKCKLCFSYYIAPHSLNSSNNPEKYINIVNINRDEIFISHLKKRILIFISFIEEVKEEEKRLKLGKTEEFPLEFKEKIIHKLKKSDIYKSVALDSLESDISYIKNWRGSKIFNKIIMPYTDKKFKLHELNSLLNEESNLKNKTSYILEIKDCMKLTALEDNFFSLENFSTVITDNFVINAQLRSTFSKSKALDFLKKKFSENELKKNFFDESFSMVFKRRNDSLVTL